MSLGYEEKLNGKVVQRPPPGKRHELIAARLHSWMKSSVTDMKTTRLGGWREAITIDSENILRPDVALVTTANGKLWLAVEVVNTEDHRVDTVWKKEVYEAMRLPRLWMVDPRYDNVEVYHGTVHGLALKDILAGQAVLSETLLPEFQLTIAKLFAEQLDESDAGLGLRC